jgi:hypothetical protein
MNFRLNYCTQIRVIDNNTVRIAVYYVYLQVISFWFVQTGNIIALTKVLIRRYLGSLADAPTSKTYYDKGNLMPRIFRHRARRHVLIVLCGLVALAGCTTDEATPTARPTNLRPTETGPTAVNSGWSFVAPVDSTVQDLVEGSSAESSLEIKADWDVQSVEYMDSWWGLGNPADANQVLTRENNGYKLGGKDVSADLVKRLVLTLSHLYPSQMLMSYHSHTDDYPSWTIELTGTDGQQILLFAQSTGNPGYGPWTVLYDGRLYAQYDGRIASAVGAIFGGRLATGRQGPEVATSSTGDAAGEPNIIQFSTSGLPNQLVYGFTGLLPISNGFSYNANLESSEIEGRIQGSSRIGSMQQGEINKLNSVKLTTGDNTTACTTTLLPVGDSFTPVTAWSFKCPVPKANAGDSYHYSIAANLGSTDGSQVDVTGTLWGKWTTEGEPQYTLLPPPDEIKAALAKNTKAQDLLADHLLAASDYTAKLPAGAPLQGTRNGEAILFGQTLVNGKAVRYTIGTQFIIQDGALTYWDLDRDQLNKMLQKIMVQPLTTRILAANASAVVNLWYANGTPEKEDTFDSHAEAYNVQVNPCGSVPGGEAPVAGSPFIAVGYNTNPYFSQAPFVLLGERLVTAHLTIRPGLDAVGTALLPSALDTGSSKPFAAINLDIAPYSGGGPTLHILEASDASDAEKAVYDGLIKALGVKTTAPDTGNVDARNVTLAIDGSGELQVMPCDKSVPTSIPVGTKAQTSANPPHLAYTTFYGGTKNGYGSNDTGQSTSANSVGVDSEGNAYIVGDTSANDLPLKNPANPNYSADLWAGFLAKFDATGSNLLLGTYVGAGSETIIRGFTLDKQGNFYLTGSAREGFPAVNSPIQPNLKGDADAYVTKLAPNGKVLFSTYLGGSDYDIGNRIAVDTDGFIYIAGSTRSSDFPLQNPFQNRYKGKGPNDRNGDAFVAKLAPDGSKLVYSTYLGGSGGDPSDALTVDSNGNAYIAGSTDSPDFPMSHPFQSEMKGTGSAYLSELSADGKELIFSTYFGEGTWAESVVLGTDSKIYIAGSTNTANMPLVKPLYPTFNGGVLYSGASTGVSDGFLATFSADGTSLLFSTFLGGTGVDSAFGLGLDAAGNVYVGGSTTSPDLPTVRPLQKDYSDLTTGLAPDSFVMKLNSNLSTVLYSTYFGADGFDSMSGMAVDLQGNVYLAGEVDGDEVGFPMAGVPFQSSNKGIRNAFVSKITDDQP